MSRTPGRVVALSNGAIAVALVAVLAGVALVVNPPAPPGIAEFAPNASKPITKAPPGQAASAGHGPSACASGASCAPSAHPRKTTAGVPTPSPRPSGVATTVQCYTWPDGSVTQTFDPQSPPCIAGWDSARGNGGATSMGVTSSEIRVAVPTSSGSISGFQKAEADFVNGHFMLYGRRIRLVPVNDSDAYSGAQGLSSPSSLRAVAKQVLAVKPFAALTTAPGFDSPPFVEELAKGKVLSVTGKVSELTSRLQAQLAPYSWGYQPGLDVVQRNLAALACSALVGHKAVHGGADVSGHIRRFAVLLHDDDTFDVHPLTDALAACGSPAKVVRIKTVGATPGDPATTQQFAQLRQDGYTSLITYSLGWTTFEAGFASNIGYTPEWVIVGKGDQAAEGQFTFQKQPNELANAYGLGTWNKLLPWSSEPWFLAAQSAGHPPTSNDADDSVGPELYHSLLVLASGIQAAGPHLTPGAFATGLHSTDFANPGAGQAPSWQATVGFGTGYGMVRDASLVWWSQGGRDYTGSASGAQGGGWCYVGNGRRYSDNWPKSDPQMSKTAACT